MPRTSGNNYCPRCSANREPCARSAVENVPKTQSLQLLNPPLKGNSPFILLNYGAMHPPSAQVLRALRSTLSHAPCRPTSRQTMPRASLQPHRQNLRCLSVTPSCSRPDDRSSRKFTSPPKPPTKPPRRFDLSTADLKAGLRDRREAAAREAAQAAAGSSSWQNKSRNVPRDRGESTEGVDERSTTTGGTDLSSFDVFADVAAPTTAVDACLDDGFHLNNGVKIGGGDGCLLVDGEVFRWRPWEAGGNDGVGLVNARGQWEVSAEAWGLLKLLWPKPGESLSHMILFWFRWFRFLGGGADCLSRSAHYRSGRHCSSYFA